MNLAPKTIKASKIPILYGIEQKIKSFNLFNKESNIASIINLENFQKAYPTQYEYLKKPKKNVRLFFDKDLVPGFSELYSIGLNTKSNYYGLLSQSGVFLIDLDKQYSGEKIFLQVRFSIKYSSEYENSVLYDLVFVWRKLNEIKKFQNEYVESKNEIDHIIKFKGNKNKLKMFGINLFKIFGLDSKNLKDEKTQITDFISINEENKKSLKINFEYLDFKIEPLQWPFLDFQTEETKKKSSPKVKKRSTNWFSGKSKDKGEEQSLLSSEESDDEWDQEMVGASKIRRI